VRDAVGEQLDEALQAPRGHLGQRRLRETAVPAAAEDGEQGAGVHELEHARQAAVVVEEDGVAAHNVGGCVAGGAAEHLGLLARGGARVERLLEREDLARAAVAHHGHSGEAALAEVADPVVLRRLRLKRQRRGHRHGGLVVEHEVRSGAGDRASHTWFEDGMGDGNALVSGLASL
jgi:hypothetical protein